MLPWEPQLAVTRQFVYNCKCTFLERICANLFLATGIIRISKNVLLENSGSSPHYVNNRNLEQHEGGKQVSFVSWQVSELTKSSHCPSLLST